MIRPRDPFLGAALLLAAAWIEGARRSGAPAGRAALEAFAVVALALAAKKWLFRSPGGPGS